MASLQLISKSTASGDADVVLIHGLGGSGTHTWRGAFPAELATEVDGLACVWTVTYGASPISNQPTIEGRARSLLHVLQSNGLGYRPLVFVAHSLGGLIVKQLLATSNESQGSASRIIASTRGVLFLATPHRGSKLASFFRRIPIAKNLVDELRWEHPDLIYLQGYYQALSRSRGIPVFAYAEQKPMRWAGVSVGLVVELESAHPWKGEYAIELDGVDHCEITCPANATEEVFKGVTYQVRQWLNAPAPIPPPKQGVDDFVDSFYTAIQPQGAWTSLPLMTLVIDNSFDWKEALAYYIASATIQTVGAKGRIRYNGMLRFWMVPSEKPPYSKPTVQLWTAQPDIAAHYLAEISSARPLVARLAVSSGGIHDSEITTWHREVRERIARILGSLHVEFEFPDPTESELVGGVSRVFSMWVDFNGPENKIRIAEEDASEAINMEHRLTTSELIRGLSVNLASYWEPYASDSRFLQLYASLAMFRDLHPWLIEISTEDPEVWRVGESWRHFVEDHLFSTDQQATNGSVDPE